MTFSWSLRLLLVFFLNLSRESLAGIRPKAFRPFAGLSFLDLQHNDWLGNGPGARARRMMAETSESNKTMPLWEQRAQHGSHVGSDGAQVHFHAEGRPHRRYTHIFSADLELGISHVFCQQFGGRNIAILAQGSHQVLQSLKEAVRFADGQDGQVLFVGSAGWDCDPGYHWYAEIDRISSEMRGAVQFSAKLLEFQEVFENLELRFSLRPPSTNHSRTHGRRLDDSMFKETTAGTEYGFNWDWENQRPLTSPLSLLGEEVNLGSTVTAGIDIKCVECFARAVGSLDIKYSYNLLQPRIYVALHGNAEVHGWVELSAQAHAYAHDWSRMIASFELPTIHFSYVGLPVSITPFTQLRSLTRLSSARMLGSMRGGFGARGHIIGTFHMNTKGWNELPEHVEGENGVDANLAINFGNKLVTPSFAFEAESTDVSFRLIPSVGVRLWRSLAVEMRAEAYIGAQIVRADGDYSFGDAAGATPEGVLYVRPEEIGELREWAFGKGGYTLVVEINGEKSTYNPLAGVEFVSYRTKDGPEDKMEPFFNFGASKLGADEHMSFATTMRRHMVETGKFTMEAEMTILEKQMLFRGRLEENRGEACEEVERSDYTMVKCDVYISLEEVKDEGYGSRLGMLKLVLFWVPKGSNFLPTGVEGLYFVHPPRAVPEKNLAEAVWSSGEKYFLAWVLDPEEVMRVEKQPDGAMQQWLTKWGMFTGKKYYDNTQANPGFRLSLEIVGGDPLDIKEGVREIVKRDLSYPEWSFDWMHMPDVAAGHRVRFTAYWNNMKGDKGEPMSKAVEVIVKPPAECDFVLNQPEEKHMMQAWEDLMVTWRLLDGVDGRVTIQVRDGSTWELMHKKKHIDATKRQIRIAWLHMRAEYARNRAVILLVTFKSTTGRPVTILRHLDVDLPPNMIDRRLGGVTLGNIRENMFKHCVPTGQYAMFGGLDVSGHVWRMGSCEDKKVYCPEGEIIGGNHRILTPAALGCKDARGGNGWCSGLLHSCSHGKTQVTDRPVVALQISKRMETIPALKQLEQLKTRIALALSLMPEDISLTNISALMDRAPELLFQVIGQSDLQITPELIQSVVDSGQLAFQDGSLLVPLAEKVLTGGRRMQTKRRLLACEENQPYSPLGVSLATDAEDVRTPLCSMSPLSMAVGDEETEADGDGFAIVGVQFRKKADSLDPETVVGRMSEVEGSLKSLKSSNTILMWVAIVQCIGLVGVGLFSVRFNWFGSKRNARMPDAPLGMEMTWTSSGPPMPSRH